MKKRFANKNILIVGASTGIGHEAARMVLAEGGTVWVAGRNKPDLEVEFLKWDALAPEDSVFDSLPETMHGLIYCAGTINLKPFGRLKLENFNTDFQINTLGAVAALQPNINRLKKSNGAGVVFFSSVAANTGFTFHTSIAMAKAGLQGLAIALAAEFALAGIRFNVIAPSLTDTPLAEQLLSSEDRREASAKRHPLGRFGTPQDLATAATYLVSEDASWITGQILGVDGGLGKLK
ncbi:SDR family NAD(P)-dependent oxidoreductase [Persicitalea jodogahamensis]|uniref:Oxidoreductase n=1 Tax=Persicitalea jodogahamensis TaxID=402147 RepID=A0A8J3D6Q5_9BACT|nr:SDR family oxidoreductase [Persicitalea jodogahamensis]GHB82029.1 oxidoreductase [Persicitalea jodogahamensis]